MAWLKLLWPVFLIVVVLVVIIMMIPHGVVISHVVLHEEHEVILHQTQENQRSLQELHNKMDILLNIATNVNRDVQFVK